MLLSFALLASAALSVSCATPDVSNAPPDVLQRCQAELGVEQREPPDGAADEPFSPVDAGGDATMQDAATAEEEARVQAAPPSEVLLYRCIAAHGVALTAQQTATLDEWQEARGDEQR